MAHDLVLADHRSPAFPGASVVPGLVVDAGEAVVQRYVEFFAAQIRNANTRAAYVRAASDFFGWCGRHGLALAAIGPMHVAVWVESLGQAGLSAPSVKQRLAAIRMLFDWLVVGQVVPHNPAAAVHGPKHSVAKGKTRMPTREEAKALLAAIPTDGVVGLRDRALIGTLFYTFARVGAATAMRVGDYYPVGRRWWVRLREKGGRYHEMPCHHALQDWLDAYLAAAGIEADTRGPLFRTAAGRTGRLTAAAMTQPDVYRMIGRRATAAGVATRIGCHSWRARGITAYLENGGLLEHAQAMAGHASARTTKLYDRRGEQVSLDEVERITL
ncbi:Tyrosine-type recombinase/integrase (plasmid) [Rhodovastum atsumiense]|uniref:Tyrosine-type recombinase/integrase n=1 Tax=Rhodovastum atsumiense TaxID=504468 RepID=A0A5M6IM21_9PROT|nr:tyrosine-type recombinase/integrase [Rhodovastum atsumiense]KAA5608625.1 tyrosine-type recombinase/integrase [Rhodovastum atsumiense]CAH2605992.1 Tyrosine-type recombinase/integrase [Rhodovastum atsumiense]